MYNLHSIPPNIWFIFAFHLVLFHKYNRFRTQYYNPTRKAGLKKEYETLFYQYHRMIHSCLLESKKQKESIPSCYSSKIKVSPLPFSLSNRQNLQILSNRFTNPFKSENRTFNKSFSDFITYICFIHNGNSWKTHYYIQHICAFVPTAK